MSVQPGIHREGYPAPGVTGDDRQDDCPAPDARDVPAFPVNSPDALYAPDLNPDELVWSHVKRTGKARRPLKKGETPREKLEERLAAPRKRPGVIRSFFNAPSVAYISDW